MVQNQTAFLIVKKIEPTMMKSSTKKLVTFARSAKFFWGQNLKIAEFERQKDDIVFPLTPPPPPVV